jgi:hypothetical protein
MVTDAAGDFAVPLCRGGLPGGSGYGATSGGGF